MRLDKFEEIVESLIFKEVEAQEVNDCGSEATNKQLEDGENRKL